MKNLRVAGLALLLLSASVIGVKAQDLTATSPGVTPTHFHWTYSPNDGSYKTYHFDSQHGWWNATMTKGDVTLSEHGVIPTKDRLPFYWGLAHNKAWDLATNPKSSSTGPNYYYLVTMGSDEHEVAFGSGSGAQYDAFVAYVNGSLVGQEQKALEGRLSSVPVNPGKK